LLQNVHPKMQHYALSAAGQKIFHHGGIGEILSTHISFSQNLCLKIQDLWQEIPIFGNL